ncbi:glycosyltransferase [Gulosibacter sp. 10]|uniref:glycosyltransferase n=1 Tax=Gulosibacter sp. 10 TaxID=1255570 RepID=UPI00097E76DE|nr:glycosyltransferase [Gulosibacter sp. 10]SJM56184.1 Glycosyltransferase MshA involved in mycothiol biosynthesis [Gulosibacter sp. 10]
MTPDANAVAPFRIAFVVLHTSPIDEPGTKDAGGMNVVVRAQAEVLAREGHSVELITRRQSPDSPASVELAPNLRLHYLDVGPARTIEKGEHEHLIDEFREALAELLRDLPVDLIHGEHWFSGIAALPVARDLDIPFVQSFHSIAADSALPLSAGERAESPGRLEGEARLAREACALVVISEAERETAITRLGADPDRISIVPPGVDAALFHPEPEGSAARRRPRAIVAGRLHPLKGVDLAIEALAAIPEASRPELVIVGTPPPDSVDYERSLREAVAQHSLEEHVRFSGALSRSGFAAEMRRGDLVLMPSHSETFGLVALEAAACGLPVIAYRSGGLQESVLHDRTGLLVDTRDPGDWADAIARVLGDPALAERLGSAALAHARSMTWEASAAELLGVYCELVECSRREKEAVRG